jgi:hypothetical protein
MMMSLSELPRQTRVFLATQAVDGRKGFRGLCALVRAMVGGDPPWHSLWVFPPTRREGLLRMLYWNGYRFFMIVTEYLTPPPGPVFFQEMSLTAFRRWLPRR